ncbi:MAG: acyl-CoA thioesterase [Pseudomonadota bacterium]
MYRLDFEVRDSEIDQQGVVNNANYFIYMAHTRHKFLQEIGIDFAEFTENKQLLFLIESHIKFQSPLLPSDKFYVTCELFPQGKLKFLFKQQVIKSEGEIIAATADNIGVCMDCRDPAKKRPYVPDILRKQFV